MVVINIRQVCGEPAGFFFNLILDFSNKSITVVIMNYETEVNLIVSKLRESGFALSAIDDGGDDNIKTSDWSEAAEHILAVDESRIFATDDCGKRVGILIVLGNCPGEAICDHSCHPELDRISEEVWSAYNPD